MPISPILPSWPLRLGAWRPALSVQRLWLVARPSLHAPSRVAFQAAPSFFAAGLRRRGSGRRQPVTSQHPAGWARCRGARGCQCVGVAFLARMWPRMAWHGRPNPPRAHAAAARTETPCRLRPLSPAGARIHLRHERSRALQATRAGVGGHARLHQHAHAPYAKHPSCSRGVRRPLPHCQMPMLMCGPEICPLGQVLRQASAIQPTACCVVACRGPSLHLIDGAASSCRGCCPAAPIVEERRTTGCLQATFLL